MRSRSLLQVAASVLAVGVAGVSVSAADPSRTATFVGCYDTSSTMFKAATFRAEHIKSLDDCLNVCDPSFGMTYGFWDESGSTCRCTEAAQSVKALVAESQEGVCPANTSMGFAVDQPYDLVSCISSPNDSSGHTALTGTPIRVSVPDECFTHCSAAAAVAIAAGSSATGTESWAYMVPLPSLGEYYCGCGDRYVDPGTTTKCGTGSWYVFGETAALQAITQ